MKKSVYILIIGFALFFLASPGFSQEATQAKDIRFTVKTNPISALGGPLWASIVPLTAEYKVYFEIKTSSKQSIQLGLGYLGTSPIIKNAADIGGDTSIVSSGFHGQLWYKFFLTSDKAPGGFYIGPHISYAFAKTKNNLVETNYMNATKLNVHCVFGYQVITKGGFALDIYTGIGLKRKTYDFPNQTLNNVFSDLEIKDKTTVSVPLGVTFGYAF